MTFEINKRELLFREKPSFLTRQPDRLRRFDNHEQMSLAASQFIIDFIEDVFSKKDECFICLAGGKTPVQTYQSLTSAFQNSFVMPSSGTIHFFLGDERIVPPDDQDSNTKMICDNLMISLPPAKAVFHAPDTLLSSPSKIAADYENRIRNILPIRNEMPIFDLILLGLGTDGHTASIFSDTLNDHKKKGWVLPVPKNPNRIHERVTLSLSVINSAHQILFLISGKEKHVVLDQVLLQNPEFPASRIQPNHDRLLYFVSS